MPNSPLPASILFLDSDCLFCQRSAMMLHRLDRRRRLHFSSLQGETAQMLPEEWRDMNHANAAAVFVEHANTPEEVRWRGCDAILRSLKTLGFPFSLLWGFHWLPQLLKNFLYTQVASLRYRISRHVNCPIPTAAFKKQVLK